MLVLSRLHEMSDIFPTSESRIWKINEPIYHILNGEGNSQCLGRSGASTEAGRSLLRLGAYGLDGSSCLVIMGTGRRSAIVVARMKSSSPYKYPDHGRLGITEEVCCTSSREENYTSLLRSAIHYTMRHPELVELPVAWGILCQHQGEAPQDHFK